MPCRGHIFVLLLLLWQVTPQQVSQIYRAEQLYSNIPHHQSTAAAAPQPFPHCAPDKSAAGNDDDVATSDITMPSKDDDSNADNASCSSTAGNKMKSTSRSKKKLPVPTPKADYYNPLLTKGIWTLHFYVFLKSN